MNLKAHLSILSTRVSARSLSAPISSFAALAFALPGYPAIPSRYQEEAHYCHVALAPTDKAHLKKLFESYLRSLDSSIPTAELASALQYSGFGLPLLKGLEYRAYLQSFIRTRTTGRTGGEGKRNEIGSPRFRESDHASYLNLTEEERALVDSLSVSEYMEIPSGMRVALMKAMGDTSSDTQNSIESNFDQAEEQKDRDKRDALEESAPAADDPESLRGSFRNPRYPYPYPRAINSFIAAYDFLRPPLSHLPHIAQSNVLDESVSAFFREIASSAGAIQLRDSLQRMNDLIGVGSVLHYSELPVEVHSRISEPVWGFFDQSRRLLRKTYFTKREDASRALALALAFWPQRDNRAIRLTSREIRDDGSIRYIVEDEQRRSAYIFDVCVQPGLPDQMGVCNKAGQILRIFPRCGPEVVTFKLNSFWAARRRIINAIRAWQTQAQNLSGLGRLALPLPSKPNKTAADLGFRVRRCEGP